MTKKKEKQDEKKAVKTLTVSKSLKCDLTQTELLAAGQELAEACDAKNKLEDEKKSVTSGYTARLKERTAQIGILQSKVQNRFEFRQVPCKEEHDFAVGTVTTARNDTGEIVEQREMTSEERQGKLIDDDGTNAE